MPDEQGRPAAGLALEQMDVAIASLSSPTVVGSPFGELRFFDGVPTPETVSTIYDTLDLIRGIEVFLNTVPGSVTGGVPSGAAVGRGQVAGRHRVHRPAGELVDRVTDTEHRDHLWHDDA